MNSRSLNPFLVSLALFAGLIPSARVSAANASAMEAFTTPLSGLRSSSVDASGSIVASQSVTPAPKVPASATPAPVAVNPVPAAVSQEPAKPATPAPSFVLTRDLLLSALREQLSAHYNLEGDLQLELTRSWEEPAAVSAPIVVTVAEFPKQLSSTALIRIKAMADGAIVSETSVSLRVQLLCDAWVTRQPVARDEVFDASIMDLRRVDVLRERDVLPTKIGDRNYSFTHPVASGKVLCWRDLARRPLVRKGELVEVTAIEGLLSINMRAVALQNGAAGDVVAVRNLESKKEIVGQVVSENRIQVRF